MSQEIKNSLFYDTITVSDNNQSMTLSSLFFSKRVIWFYTDVNAQSAQQLCMQLVYLAKQNSHPIYLNINSGGGSVYCALAIINTIHTISAPVYATVCGIAASAAALMFVCCAKGYRTMLPYSTLMFHQVITTNQNPMSHVDFTKSYQESSRLNKMLCKFISKSISIPYDTFMHLIDRDLYIGSVEALDMKIIDKIEQSNDESIMSELLELKKDVNSLTVNKDIYSINSNII